MAPAADGPAAEHCRHLGRQHPKQRFGLGQRDRCGAEVLAGDDRASEQLSPLRHPVPAGLAPAYLCTAGFDPLRDEGEHLARLAADAGVPVTAVRWLGQVHGFWRHHDVFSAADPAIAIKELIGGDCPSDMEMANV